MRMQSIFTGREEKKAADREAEVKKTDSDQESQREKQEDRDKFQHSDYQFIINLDELLGEELLIEEDNVTKGIITLSYMEPRTLR